MKQKPSLPKTLSWAYGAVIATAAIVYLGGYVMDKLGKQTKKDKR
jgi:hypothetical protein